MTPPPLLVVARESGQLSLCSRVLPLPLSVRPHAGAGDASRLRGGLESGGGGGGLHGALAWPAFPETTIHDPHPPCNPIPGTVRRHMSTNDSRRVIGQCSWCAGRCPSERESLMEIGSGTGLRGASWAGLARLGVAPVAAFATDAPPPPGVHQKGKGPRKRPQRRLGRQLEEVAKAVGGGYCRLQMPLKLALGVRGTVAGRRLEALEGGGGVPSCPPPPHHRRHTASLTPPH